jgi:hypothetical protein
VTSCIAVFGTCVETSASEMTFDIALKDSVDSFPPIKSRNEYQSYIGSQSLLTFQNSRVA